MWASFVIKVDITTDRSTGLADAVVGSQVHFLVLDAAPQALDEYVVSPSPVPVAAVEIVGHRRALFLQSETGIALLGRRNG